jgi:hypothetical protein
MNDINVDCHPFRVLAWNPYWQGQPCLWPDQAFKVGNISYLTSTMNRVTG